ncbi:MAG: histidinol-phosphatase [Treponema sp.]|jgi:histidinol-phosphatase (PHP family)|nr:histidinol-phosphatase [Treponema sp.]
MRFSSLHTHSVFCDGTDHIETLCRTAWEKGLSAVGFSSHAPIGRKTGFKSDWHLPDGRLEAYLDEVRSARRRWEGKIPVYLGLEVDYMAGLMGPADRDYRDMGLDYLIGSVHYLIPPKGAPFTVDGSRGETLAGIREGFDGDGGAYMNAYWDAVLGMTAEGGFDILGHADIVKKNSRGDLFSESGETWLRRGGETARAAARAGVVVEVNTGGLNRKSMGETCPSGALLRLFREAGVPAVVTSDAHRAEDLDGNYQAARRVLLDSGYTETVFLEGKKDGPGTAVWKAERL